MALYKNKASQKFAVFAYDPTTGDPVTGDAANITAQISLDGAATAATNDTNPTELDATDAPGIYLFDATQAETNADLVIVVPVSATADVLLAPLIIYTEPETRSSDVVSISGSSTAADNQEIVFDTDFATAYDTTNDQWDVSASAGGGGGDATAANQTTIITHLTDIKGATFDGSTDSIEAIRNRGDAAWVTATGFSTLDAAGVRSAVGLASANLDTQLDAIPAAVEAAILNEGDATALLAAIAAKVEEFLINDGDATATIAAIATACNSAIVAGTVGTNITAIKAKTDNLPASPAATGDIPTASEIRIEIDSNSTQLAAIVADTNEMQTDLADGGRLDLILDSRASQSSVDTIDGIVDEILVDTAEIGAAGVGLTEAGGTGDQFTSIPWNATWDAEVQSECADALGVYDPPTRAELTSDTNSVLSAVSGVDAKIDIIDTNVDTLVSRITSTLFNGITSLASWLGALAGKTADTTTRAEIQATTAGATYNETTDSQQAIADDISSGVSATVTAFTSGALDELDGTETTVTSISSSVLSVLAGTLSSGSAPNSNGSAFDRPVVSGDDYTASRPLRITVTAWEGPDIDAADTLTLHYFSSIRGIRVAGTWNIDVGDVTGAAPDFTIAITLTSSQTSVLLPGEYDVHVYGDWGGDRHSIMGPGAKMRVARRDD